MKKIPHLMIALIVLLSIIASTGAGATEKTAASAKEFKNAGEGDVIVRINGGKDKVYIGATNTLEIWIANGAEVAGMSLAFEFKSAVPYTWAQPYGNKPTGKELIQEEGDAVGVFDFGGLNIRTSGTNPVKADSIMIGGAAMKVRLPRHSKYRLCYTMQFRVASGVKEAPAGFCIDNIFYPPAGTWTFNDGSGFSPSFMGKPNSSSSKPDAPPVCFDIVNKPQDSSH